MENGVLVVVGCLNRDAPYLGSAKGRGLAVFAFDDMTGRSEMLSETDDMDNPTYLSVTRDGRSVFASSEVFNRREGVIASYALDPETGRLTYRNMQPALGSICAYNALTSDERHLLLANYGMGEGGPDRSLVVFPIHADGTLGPATDSVAHGGTGPDRDRQERAHAHCIRPVGDVLLATDLGIDRIVAYRLGPDGQLVRLANTQLSPGAGPRHLVSSADGMSVFVVNELESTVQSFRHDGAGGLRAVSTCSTVPAGVADNHCADLHLSPDGDFLYVSNRGHDSIAIFGVDREAAELAPHGEVPTAGRTPRSFALTPSGRHLLAANQDSDEIAVFLRDPDTGGLTDTQQRMKVGTPMCVKVVAR